MTVAHRHVMRDLLVLADPENPFLRVGKGMIQRSGTVELYQRLIVSQYKNLDDSKSKDRAVLDVSGVEDVTQSIVDLFMFFIGV